MPRSIEDKLVVAITTHTVFDLGAVRQLAVQQGPAAYREYQLQHVDDPLNAGPGMPLVRALLGVTDQSGQSLVEMIVVSPDDGDSGVRIVNSIEQWSLPITRFSFTGGRGTFSYLSAYA